MSEMTHCVVGAFILLNCKNSQEKDVIAQIQKIHKVKEIQRVSGPYDILVKTEASTIEKLHQGNYI